MWAIGPGPLVFFKQLYSAYETDAYRLAFETDVRINHRFITSGNVSHVVKLWAIGPGPLVFFEQLYSTYETDAYRHRLAFETDVRINHRFITSSDVSHFVKLWGTGPGPVLSSNFHARGHSNGLNFDGR